MGGNLTLCDEWTKSLLANAEVLDVDQRSTGNHVVLATDLSAVWVARPASGDGYYVAVFNLDSISQTLHYAWKDAGLPKGMYRVRDLWEHKNLRPMKSLSVTLPPHASALYKVSNP
jgi:alpha-galactosidase